MLHTLIVRLDYNDKKYFYFRADKLSPLSVPVLDRKLFPPEITKEIPKVIFPGLKFIDILFCDTF